MGKYIKRTIRQWLGCDFLEQSLNNQGAWLALVDKELAGTFQDSANLKQTRQILGALLRYLKVHYVKEEGGGTYRIEADAVPVRELQEGVRATDLDGEAHK